MKKLCALLMVICIVFLGQPASDAEAYTFHAGQDCTSYYKGTVTSSGNPVKIGYVAVHYTGSVFNPVINFNTLIQITSVKSLQGQGKTMTYVATTAGNLTYWEVQDTGPGTGLSTYWLDFYLGGPLECENFGKGTVSYYAFD